MAAWTDLPPDRSDPATHEKARWVQAGLVWAMSVALAVGIATCVLPLVAVLRASAKLIAAG